MATCDTSEIKGWSTIPTTGNDRALVVLTERGRDVLERNRWSNVHREELRWEAQERELVDRRHVDDERSKPPEPRPGRSSTPASEADARPVSPCIGRGN